MAYVGIARLSFRAGYVRSLKEKRSIVNSLKAKVKNKFNVSISETEDLDQHKSIVISVACVSSDRDIIEGTMRKVADFILNSFDVELIQEETYIDNY
ncbi:DUF503 domain-containing protein [Proteiniclasticum sp. C24MP]|uniref:DUF503 domain-containing protein n=1 Tax=Proteiniclasticum sp. C24MP TaxID=3374101 RepID=UPI003754AF18